MGPRNEYHQTKQEALTHLGQKQTQANTKASGHYKNFLALKKVVKTELRPSTLCAKTIVFGQYMTHLKHYFRSNKVSS